MNEPLENLMVKARRGVLRAEERRRLELGLNASLEATLLYQAGCGFDQEPVVMTGDETFVESLASEAARRFGHSPGNVRRRASAVAVALWVASGMAAAGTIGVAYQYVRPFPSNDHLAVTLPAQTSEVKGTSQKVPTASAVSPRCAPSAEQPGLKEAPRTGLPSITASPRQTVEALFQLANEARDNGRIDEAVRGYQRIQREFADSREALLSTMSLGMLELQRGNPQAALPSFRRAYAAHPSPEALWGEAQAVHQLGRAEQERQLLGELLSRYPGSAYAPAASKRLGTED